MASKKDFEQQLASLTQAKYDNAYQKALNQAGYIQPRTSGFQANNWSVTYSNVFNVSMFKPGDIVRFNDTSIGGKYNIAGEVVAVGPEHMPIVDWFDMSYPRKWRANKSNIGFLRVIDLQEEADVIVDNFYQGLKETVIKEQR